MMWCQLFVLITTAILFHQPAIPDISGDWENEDSEKQVQMKIYKASDGLLYGQITDDKTSSTVNGKMILKALRWNEESKTFTGKMQPPHTGIELNITVTQLTNNRMKIVAKKLMMTKTMYLKRI